MKTFVVQAQMVVESNDINDENELEILIHDLLEQFDEHFEDTKLKVKFISANEK